MRKGNIIVIPDLHCPFVHKDALNFTLEVKDRFQCETNVCLGDELDMHALSNYTVDVDGFSAGHELDRGIRSLQKWYDAYDHMLVCKSNHPKRPFARMEKIGLPKKFRRDYKDVIEAPASWRWADSHILQDIVFEHGHQAGGGKFPYANHADRNMKSTVIGHHHGAFGIYWNRTPHSLIFGMGCGWMGDEKAYSMAYAKECKRKPIVGCGVIQDGVPILIRMPMTGRGRWTGALGIEMVEPS